jgi:hypothetical protein
MLVLEPVAQLEPNFDGIVIGWSSSKIVSGSHAKGTTQESFQQSLVEIGSVVSEEKIFF